MQQSSEFRIILTILVFQEFFGANEDLAVVELLKTRRTRILLHFTQTRGMYSFFHI